MLFNQKKFSDLDFNFLPHPETGDLVLSRQEQAVKNSVRNLILTNFYERPFQPFHGANLITELFENVDYQSRFAIYSKIKNVLERLEPRIKLLALDVNIIEDSSEIRVTLTYSIENFQQPQQLSVLLERIR